MADDEEKTEEPTPKKIEQAKEEGNVHKSVEVVGAAILTLGSAYLIFWSSFSFTQIKKLMLFIYGLIGQELNDGIYYVITKTVITTSFYALFPIFLLVYVLIFAFHWIQFGMIVTPFKLDLKKLDPISGFKNVFSLKKLLEALKLFAKLTIIFLVMVVLFMVTGDYFLAMMDKGLFASIDSMIELAAYFIATILLIIIIFAIMDYYFTRFYYLKSLRMSKQDIKDEFKNMEGDPQVKGRIRSIQMKMAQQRMLQEVSDADVVITNPTHYAVALTYDNQQNSAPLVVAKGIDFLALKIKDIARENDIPIVENPPLARALYVQVEVEQEIPQEYYKAVADIFGFVYELKNK